MYYLVADVGGTNSRYALCKAGDMDLMQARKYPNREFDSLKASIEHYLSDVGETPVAACLAVAGPAHGDDIRLTNIDWHFSVEEYRKHFNFERLLLTNDFTALAMSVPHLRKENIRQVGKGKSVKHQPISVLGPGTGLGVSGLLWNGRSWTALQGEGGNVDFTPILEEEMALLALAKKEHAHVRTEDFVSGTGLTYLHDLRLELHGHKREGMAAQDIAWRAKMEDTGMHRDTIYLFCGMLGGFAGNQALTLGAFGGVYIGGGVAPQLEELFDTSPFRERFEMKGRFHDYVKQIPTYIMLSHSRNALIGAAAMVTQTLTSPS